MSSSVAVAAALLRAGNLAGARREIGSALEQEPNSGEASAVLVDIALAEEDFPEAQRIAEAWLARDANDPRAHQAYFNALCHMRNRKGARKLFDEYVGLFPLDPFSHERMRLAYSWVFESPRKALHALHRLRKAYPGLAGFDHAEALLQASRGRWISAMRAADRSLAHNPTDADLLHLKTYYYYMTGRFISAIRHARRMRETDPRKASKAGWFIALSYVGMFPLFYVSHLINAAIVPFLQLDLKYKIAATAPTILAILIAIPFIILSLQDIFKNTVLYELGDITFGACFYYFVTLRATLHLMKDTKKYKNKPILLNDSY